MSWKFVLNGNFKNVIEASSVAGKVGCKFFLFGGKVYFRDGITLRIYDTEIRENDLF